ncbi:MAG: thioredoxin family protein [Planctomycetota bacterium]
MGKEPWFTEEHQFALFLKKQKTLPAPKLQYCLDEQKRRYPEQVQLSALLVERGVLSVDQIADLLTQWKGGKVRVTADISTPPIAERPLPEELGTASEQAFLKLLRTSALLTPEQLDQAIIEQKRERNKGRYIQLSSILLQRKWFSEEQLQEYLTKAFISAKVRIVGEEVPPQPIRIERNQSPKVQKIKKIAQFRAKKEPKPKIPKAPKPKIQKAPKLKPAKKAVAIRRIPEPKPPIKKAVNVPKITPITPTPLSIVAASTRSLFQNLAFSQACEKAGQENKWVLLYFYADWAAPCKLYEATTWADEDISAWTESNAIALKINLDQESVLTAQFQMRTVPLVILCSPDQKTVHRIEGYQNADNFLNAVKSWTLPKQKKILRPEVIPTILSNLLTSDVALEGVSLSTLSQLIDQKLEALARKLAGQGSGSASGGNPIQGKTAAKNAKEGDEVEINEHKYRVLSEAVVLDNLEKGIEMENVYVSRISAPQKTFSNKISMKSSYVVEADFTESTFEHHLTFSGTAFEEKPIFAKTKFLKDANFKGCFFARGGDFKSIRCDKEFHMNGLISKGYVTFQAGDFRGRSIFTRADFETESNFLEARFKDHASFSEAHFGGRATFEKLRFSKEVSFSNSTFGFTTMFKSTEFVGECKFLNVVFEGSVWFSHCKFQDNMSFKGSTFRAEGVFNAAKFEKMAEFEGVAGDRFISFLQVVPSAETSFIFSNTSMNKITIHRETLENHISYHKEENWKKAQKEYGLLKNNFNEINEYEDEDWAYLWEKRCERYQVPVSWRHPKDTLMKFVNWLVLDIVCGYGTKPINTLFSAATIIFSFALFYWGLNQIQPHFGADVLSGVANNTELSRLLTSEYNSLQHCLFYSFKIFTATEIPSVEPSIHPLHPIHVLILIESFLGIFMITILVIAFSRKVIR